MPKKSGERLAISLSENVLKIAAVKAGNPPRVLQVSAQDIKGTPAADLPRLIQAGLKGFKTKGGDVVCVVPSSMTTTKNIEIPSTDEEEIRAIVSLQAGRHTPFSRDEIQIGYVNLGIHKTSYTKVLLVIANRSRIKSQLDLLAKAGLKVSRVLFAPEGVAGFYADALKARADVRPFTVIDVDRDQTDVVIVSGGLPVTSRSIPVGQAQMVLDPSSGVNSLVGELKETLNSYQNDDIGQMPESFFLAGNNPGSEVIQGVLKANLGWHVQPAVYTEYVKSSKGVLKRISERFPDTSFADVISAAAVAPELQVNLLPEEIMIQKTVEDQGRQIFQAAVLGIIVLFFVGAGLGSKVFFRNAFLQRLVNNYRPVQDEVSSLMAQQKRTQIIKNYMADRMASLDILNEFYQHIPQTIYLTGVVMEEDGAVTIQGVSESGSEVYNFGTTLEGLELFSKAQVRSTTARKDRGKDATAFEIAITLASARTEDGQE
jgi:Tfp pilus assembly PilM family ATPase/Tfp pilus assembly protein PilN